MAGELLCNRLDVPVNLVDGGSTNLGHFCGQKLVIFFCPAADGAAAAEVGTYEALAGEFEHSGAWVVGIVDEDAHEIHGGSANARINLGTDPDGTAFRRLVDNLPPKVKLARSEGATFVVGRDGAIHYAWADGGHAARALEAARERP
jgi:peroxiredoxin